MAVYKFDEVLNDLMDYFILGDPDYLLQYKIENDLPDDLLTEFTTEETGDQVVEQGVIVPMIGIENYPYTIYFNLSDETPELLKAENEVQHQRDGYCLKVVNGRIYLYTIPYLRDFTETKVGLLKKYKHASIELPNGWYTVTILAGLTKQLLEAEMVSGKIEEFESMEPTFEFVLKPSAEKPEYAADFTYPFKVEIDE
ncbi:hypothetical protein [Flavobacterium johnsoniae]|uniref:Uncharacterized protein n=1 Tax=Flavobacterium johnsoniae (strain ATCC 17061 / DSM 2064 / JCM 8514 / BCRC 14874 / CCUG 350202 / NBRC 14942 / NCIMB 11054 / UW101) TaxID=376686 RepID=A5FCB8_FLAJ1|nr:hypothetical protein [Flavobacterium johnsoniae]ABQ07155.1 hypothetical protein Fjoh_4147 [Flavobacterium johnsoniae UW101]OXE98870.1 hypothetical protein B0A63_14610 [Flavobacterium johnsoniae UW101]WQG81006.1 hypothetical protein SR927_23725 [Flavobacterium johnsoniae UW101]SHL28767.1 hypothetical protein SAMN05444146_3364 [Flavobacterium johnsoniae]